MEIKSKFKDKLPIIIIVLLLLFSVSKCTQSCNRSITIDKTMTELEQRDSILTVMKDSIVVLNQKIELLQNDKKNQQVLVDAQKDAIDKINEAKKNINVTVKK